MTLAPALVHHLRVDGRRLDVGVAHLILNVYQVSAIAQAEHGACCSY